MNRNFILLIWFIIFSTVYTSAQNQVCFNVQENPNISDPALSVFSKYINVYDCSIYGESSVSDEKMLHAASIFAELIDNDEDGIPDDPELISILVENEALIPIFQSDGNNAMEVFMNNYNGNGASAVLWQSEMDPSQPGKWGSDATVEEILHTINHVGHVNLYPEAFGLNPNTSLLSEAMDLARGGQFLSVPQNYPPESWYHYDDVTCDYECMAIEYLYWCIVSWMGILDDPGTCNGISNEWELCSPTLFQNGDILMHQLITNPAYKIPQNAPDGNYCPPTSGFNNTPFLDKPILYPNPFQDEIHFFINEKIVDFRIFNSIGKELKINKDLTKNTFELGFLENGIYVFDVETEKRLHQTKAVKYR